ncbi:MAG TPA: GNAT family protein [Ideonella sp.]|nr:GNAT family protein [Ideonella sp.]
MLYSHLPVSSHAQVVLRPLQPADAQPWFRYLSLPEVYEHTSWNVQAADELLPMIAAHEPATAASPVRFAIALLGTGELVGTAGFHTVSPLNRTAEIAYDLAPPCWGQGIATAVCASLVAWAFAQAGLVRVQATVLQSNARSARVLRRCGFEREGLLRHYRMVRGTPGDFWMYSVLRPPAPQPVSMAA